MQEPHLNAAPPLERSAKNYWKLFLSTFMLSAFTFGGGYVIVPLMKKKFADELGWLEEAEMLNLVAMAQSAPGPIAVNASILVGWQVLGVFGALCSIVGTVLPPLIIITAISFFYDAFRSNAVVAAVLRGMMAGVAAVIADVVLNMGGKVVGQKKPLPLLLMAGAFLATYALGVNVIYIILFSGTLGALVTLADQRSGKERL